MRKKLLVFIIASSIIVGIVVFRSKEETENCISKYGKRYCTSEQTFTIQKTDDQKLEDLVLTKLEDLDYQLSAEQKKVIARGLVRSSKDTFKDLEGRKQFIEKILNNKEVKDQIMMWITR